MRSVLVALKLQVMSFDEALLLWAEYADLDNEAHRESYSPATASCARNAW
jgi:hypothetical protein